MKMARIFYLENCPYCKRAFRYIEELKREYPEFQDIVIDTIDEKQQPDIADKYDYYSVPAFYVDYRKAHEGSISKGEVEEILRDVIR